MPADVTPSPEGHDQAMIDKVDASAAAALSAAGGAPAQPEAPVKPEGVPDKFWNAETGQVDVAALAKSYTELEKGRSQEPPADAPKDPEAPPQDPDKAAAEAAVGADAFAAFSAEFAEKGELSQESYAALEAKGIPKDIVDSYIAGQQALASAIEAHAYATAGGKEAMQTMLDWAAKSLSPADIAAFDGAVVSPDSAVREQAILGLKARFEASYGSPQAGLIKGDQTGGLVGYQSQAEMTADMKDPRYQSDPAFRKAVEMKLSVTTAF